MKELSGLGRDELLKIIERLERHCDEQAVEFSALRSELRIKLEEAKQGFKRALRQAVFPRIVCLCGSTRFGEAFRKANFDETLAGKIVLTVGCDFKSDDALELAPYVKERLDELHKRKIDLADEIFVLNELCCTRCGRVRPEEEKKGSGLILPDGRAGCGTVGIPPCDFKPYIGESATSEILYAAGLGKPVRWLNPPGCFTLPDGSCIGAGCMHDDGGNDT